jgi:hypothetical protein
MFVLKSKNLNMKKNKLSLIFIACITILSSCKSLKGKAFESTEGVAEVVTKLNETFGDGASYTDITISYFKGIGSTISATGTNDPSSTKLISKVFSNGKWEESSEVILEVSGGAKPSDFMFTLKDVDQLKKVPEMVRFSIEKIKKEKNFDVVAEHVSVKYPSRITGPDDKLSFDVNLAPENGGTSFISTFDELGNHKRINY